MQAADLVHRHREELVTALSPIYGMFDALDAATWPDAVARPVRHEALRIAELVVLYERTSGGRAAETARAIAALPGDEALAAIVAWREALETGGRDRTSTELLLAEFAPLFALADAARRAAFVETFPALAGAVPALGPERTAEVVARLLRCAAADELRAVAGAVAGAAERGGRATSALLAGVDGWLAAGTPTLRAVLLESLPALAPAVADLGVDGVTDLLARAAAGADEWMRRTFPGVARFACLGGRAVHVVFGVAVEAGRCDGIDRFEALAGAVGPETFLDRDSRRFPPALGELSTAAAALGPDAWKGAVGMTAALLEGSASSATVAAQRARAAAAGMPHAVAAAYLQACETVATRVGVRAVGFLTRGLPRLFERQAAARASAFAEHVAAVAEADGVTAAQWLFEGRTRAARELLGS